MDLRETGLQMSWHSTYESAKAFGDYSDRVATATGRAGTLATRVPASYAR